MVLKFLLTCFICLVLKAKYYECFSNDDFEQQIEAYENVGLQNDPADFSYRLIFDGIQSLDGQQIDLILRTVDEDVRCKKVVDNYHQIRLDCTHESGHARRFSVSFIIESENMEDALKSNVGGKRMGCVRVGKSSKCGNEIELKCSDTSGRRYQFSLDHGGQLKVMNEQQINDFVDQLDVEMRCKRVDVPSNNPTKIVLECYDNITRNRRRLAVDISVINEVVNGKIICRRINFDADDVTIDCDDQSNNRRYAFNVNNLKMKQHSEGENRSIQLY